MRLKHLGLVAALAIGARASAQDLESILDDGGTKAKTGKKQEATAPKEYSALYYVLKKELPRPHPDQALFMREVEAGEWDKAVLQYPVAFEGTPFQKSADGRAMFALAHFKAGMPVTGLELLFRLDNPRTVAPEIRRLWKEAAAPSNPAWDVAQIAWKPGFTEVFGAETEFRVTARDLASQKDPKKLMTEFSKLPGNSLERQRVGWQLVIAYGLSNQVEDAAKVLANVMKSEPAPVSQDLMNLTAARLLYQRAMYAPAIKYYEKVAKTSEYWTDAQEEMAWSYIRRGEPQNAMAISQSLVTPAMVSQTGAEGFFVHSLGQLKVCDYPGVISTLGEFAKRFKARNAVLEQSASTTDNPDVKKAIDLLKTKRISREDLGATAQNLPRLIARDERLYRFAQADRVLQDEAKAADLVYAKSLAMTGLQGYFDKLRQTISGRAHNAEAAAQNRVKELAKIESSEIKNILRKLHIVEAEVIQQVAVADRVIEKTRGPATEKKGTTGAKNDEVLKFPAENEVWFDEIGNYRVNVKKSCQAEGTSKKI